MLEHLITDRTLSDVEYVEQLTLAVKNGTATEAQVQEFLSVPQKGAYTWEDMNRVEAAVRYVSDRLNALGYDNTLVIVEDWEISDTPNEADMNRYFSNVAQIRAAVSVFATTPEAPRSVIGFDVFKANDLEKILIDVDRVLDHIQCSAFYLGDLYLGEV